MNDEQKQEITNNLKIALPYLVRAIDAAAEKGKVKLYIGAEKPDGSGKHEAIFDVELIEDVAKLLGVEREDLPKKNYNAKRFLDRLGLKPSDKLPK